jgi:hypothetical protein
MLLILFEALVVFANYAPSVRADGNVIVISHTGFEDYSYGGIYNVFGEVQNTGNQAVGYTIAATFYNSKNEVVATSFLSPEQPNHLTILLPNRKSPFEIDLPSSKVNITGIDHYALEVTTSPPNKFIQGLEVKSNQFNITGEGLQITGEIKNVGSKAMDEIEILATFYNATGAVVAVGSVGWGYSADVNGQPGFHPNQTDTFYLTLAEGVFAAVYPTIDHYALTTEGQTYADKTTYCLGSTVAVNLTASDITEKSLKLTWAQSNADLFARYEVFQSTTAGVLGTLTASILRKTTTSWTVTNLSPSTTYYYTVRVVDTESLTADSDQLTVMTADVPWWRQPWFIGSVAVIIIVAIATVIVVCKRKRLKIPPVKRQDTN